MRRAALGGLLLAAALGCSAAGREDAKGPDPSAGAAARPVVAVEWVAAEVRDLSEVVEVVGTLEPKFEAEVKAEVPGTVTEMAVTQWVRVAKGQLLARLDARELEASLQRARAAVEAARASEDAARAGLLEARVVADRADREYDRVVRLKEAGLATQQSVDDGLTARDAARARIAAVQGQIAAAAAQVGAAREDVRQIEARLAKAVLRSPLDGVVAERGANVGDLPGDAPLFRIVDNRLLNLTVTVPSRDLARVRRGQAVTFSTDALPGESFAGRVMFINPSVDPVDRSVKVVAEVPNPTERLKGGLFVKGRIETGSRRGVLQVPRGALLAWDVASARGDLFVVDGPAARRRSVRTGATSGDRIEVTAGLTPGERVVVRGGYQLKDGDPVRSAPPPAPPPRVAGG